MRLMTEYVDLVCGEGPIVEHLYELYHKLQYYFSAQNSENLRKSHSLPTKEAIFY